MHFLSLSQFLDLVGMLVPRQTLVEEVCEGLCEYFDRALPAVLLYRFERPQYRQLLAEHPGKAPSQLFGGNHLLRLFGTSIRVADAVCPALLLVELFVASHAFIAPEPNPECK